MEPLTAWLCDTCGEAIASGNLGNVVWHSDQEFRKHDFRIVHKGACDPDRRMQSLGISDLVGPAGQAHLLSWLSYGKIMNHTGPLRVVDIDAYTDLFRRLQTPWYEEARPYFQSASVKDGWGDANEVAPYEPYALQRIAIEGRSSSED
jgi:hypothetical protein